MAEKRKPQRSGSPINVRIAPRLKAAVDRFESESSPKTSITGIVEAALEEYLRARGYWPHKEDPAVQADPPKRKPGRRPKHPPV